jgi:TonB family protein
MIKRVGFTSFFIGATTIVLAILIAPLSVATEDTEPPQPVATDSEVLPPEIILKTQKAPVYPPAAKAARFNGVVTVKVHIDLDGKVSNIEVVECTHKNIGFEEATVAAVELWEFHPAMLKGEPVEFDSQFRLSFRTGPSGATTSAHGSSGRSGIVRPPTVSLSTAGLK